MAASPKRQNGCIAEELLVEILVRLPVKSLIRSKATCKSWHSLIESPSFVDFHRRRRYQDHRDRLLFCRYNEEESKCRVYSYSAPSDVNDSDQITTQPFDFGWIPEVVFEEWPLDPPDSGDESDDLPASPYTVILGPLNNGIYCLIDNDCQRPKRISVATSKIALCNPTTREYKFTNPFPSDVAALLTDDIARKLSLAHNGFGNIRDNSGIVVDYKVVVIILSGEAYSHFTSFVYSLQRRSWEKIADVRHGTRYTSNKAISGLVNERGEVETPRLISCDIGGCAQLFFNGSWHWLEVLPPITSDKYDDRVLFFDVANEVFGLIGGPPHDYLGYNYDHSYVHGGLSLLNGHLATVYMPNVDDIHNNGWRCVGIDVWMMMKYGVEESWTKIYSCETDFNRSFRWVVGLCYSAATTKDRTDHSSSNVQIHRIFLDDAVTKQLVSWDGSRIKEHDFYIQKDDILWNTLGISTYVETLESLTLTHCLGHQ